MAKWQQWRRVDPNRFAGKNCNEKLRSDMNFSTPVAEAVLLAIWFKVLFAGVPFGVRSQHETGYIAALTDPGAPVAPRLVGKSI